MGALATCQTNITCLLELADALQSGTNINRADEKIQQITGLLCMRVVHWNDCDSGVFVIAVVWVQSISRISDGHIMYFNTIS